MIKLKIHLLNRLVLRFAWHGDGVYLTEPSLILCQCQLLVFSGKHANGLAATLHRSQLWQDWDNPAWIPACPGILAWAVTVWPGWLCDHRLGQNSVWSVTPLLFLSISGVSSLAIQPSFSGQAILSPGLTFQSQFINKLDPKEHLFEAEILICCCCCNSLCHNSFWISNERSESCYTTCCTTEQQKRII